MSRQVFCGTSIYFMNQSYPFNFTIKNANSLIGTENYYLYPTGYATLSGRQYIALPENLKITQEIINEHNLLVSFNHDNNFVNY